MSQLHSMQIEQAVLSTLMTVENALNNAEAKPTIEDFYANRHQLIFKSIEELNIQGKAYDAQMVLDHLTTKGEIKIVGGEEYLIEVTSNFSPPSSFTTYVQKLKKLNECRKVEEAGKKIIELAQNTLIEDIPTKAQEIIAGVESVIATNARHTLQESAVVAFEVLNTKQQYKRNGGRESYGVRTGLRDLDALLGDVEPGHYMVVAAAPGGGKTTLAQMIALNAVKANDVPCLFISCEMEHHEVTNRIISAQCRIPFDRITTGEMNSEDYDSWISHTAHVFPNYKLDIVDKAGVTIAEIRGEIKKTIQKYGSIGCVIVDYIQLLTDPSTKDAFERISNISMGLKRIAKDFKVPVIGLSQLTKEAIGRKITMSDLRGSGQIAQDADKIVLLSPDASGVGVVISEVAKNRQGKKGEARLVAAFDYCQFANIRKQEDF